MFKTNHFGFGIILGLLSQGGLFVIIYVINNYLIQTQYIKGINLETNVLTSIFLNIILLRFYFLNLKLEKTAHGILVSTFLVTAISYILINIL